MQDPAGGEEVAHDDRPIGVFDSGVGGLSVLRAIRQELPRESLMYVGDSEYAPYGDRSADFVLKRSTELTRFLLEQGAKALVVACNTATAIAVEELRKRFTVPVVAIEPAVKPAALRTRSGVVGVLVTAGTASSPNMARLLANYSRIRRGTADPPQDEPASGTAVEFVIQPCPGLADRVEKGDLSSDETRALVTRYVRPLVERRADILVLGCTHYPFLRPLIQEIAGPDVDIIDPAMAVARELRRRLQSGSLLADAAAIGSVKFWTTGTVDGKAAIVGQLWGNPVELRQLER